MSYQRRVRFMLFIFYSLELLFAIVAIYYKWLRWAESGYNLVNLSE